MIIFEEPKCRLFLTFSAIIPDDQIGKIIGLQNQIEESIKKINHLPNADELFVYSCDELYKKIDNNKLIYRYPMGRIHFSIVNCGECLIDQISSFKDFKRRADNYRQSTDYQDQKQKMIDFREQFYKFFPMPVEFQIKGFYLPKSQNEEKKENKEEEIKGAISLQAFPKDNKFFVNIAKLVINPLTIKSYSMESQNGLKGEYFPINIFRFINKKKYTVKSGKFLDKTLGKKLDSPIEIHIMPQIVISDPYLANDDYDKF